MSGSTRNSLRALIADKAIVRGPITLSSGAISAYYFDCRRLTLNADGAAAVGEAVVDAIQRFDPIPRAVGGLTNGADPIVGAAMHCAYGRGLKLDGFYVRKEPKKHGTQKWIENEPAPGTPVVVVDDVVTSGKSVIDAIDRAEQEGCRVVGVVVIVDRLEGGGAKIQQRVPGAKYVALYTVADFPEIERIKAAVGNAGTGL
jgi:orotate phosphoribosyltransferase